MNRDVIFRAIIVAALILGSFGSSLAADSNFKVSVDSGRLSLQADGARLADLLEDVGLKAGIKVSFVDPEIADRKVNASFKNVSVEEGLKQILRENYVFTFTKNPGNGVSLSAVRIGDRSAARIEHMDSFDISYGKGPKAVGAIDGGEGALVGPASFHVDTAGNTYVLDTANNRIQIYSADGKHLRFIALAGTAPEDLTMDEQGNLFVYDTTGTLRQYSPQGELTQQVAIDETRWQTRGPMHFVDDKLYARVNGEGDLLIGVLENGQITPPAKEQPGYAQETIVEPGVLGVSGKRYDVELDERRRGAEIRVSGLEDSATEIHIPIEGIVSVEFLGEDRYGNFYAKTEGDRGQGLVVEVSKFDTSGAYLGTIPVPGEDYAFWSIKTVTVDDEGVVHHMMPGTEHVKLSSLNFTK